jgi:hypothetical protein
MPPKKGKVVSKKRGPRTSEEDDHQLTQTDIQYNPEIIANLLQELEKQVESKCSQIQKDTDFMISSIQQAFQLELIKLPKQVQQMSVRRFKEEYGDSLEAVTRGAMSTKPSNSVMQANAAKENRNIQQREVFQTPSHKGNNSKVMQTPSQRGPREGEQLVSANGSPLGEFTVKKAPRQQTVPSTPSVYLPLPSGNVLEINETTDDLSNYDEDIENMSHETKTETLKNMQSVMDNMQALMAKLAKPSKV